MLTPAPPVGKGNRKEYAMTVHAYKLLPEDIKKECRGAAHRTRWHAVSWDSKKLIPMPTYAKNVSKDSTGVKHVVICACGFRTRPALHSATETAMWDHKLAVGTALLASRG